MCEDYCKLRLNIFILKGKKQIKKNPHEVSQIRIVAHYYIIIKILVIEEIMLKECKYLFQGNKIDYRNHLFKKMRATLSIIVILMKICNNLH